MIAQALGGIGLFLVGMVMVTDGLRAAAGDALRHVLLRFTGGPFRALLSGAAVTAVVQSSSATTVATIGFVGAGLLTFQQSLGLIFGANLGTTATGWIVAGLGLKFSVSTVALPLVGVGAIIRLFSRSRWAHVGVALSGFGIIFVGLDVLQVGMEGISDQLTPSQLPQDSWGGRLFLVTAGFLLTAVLQSSSAAMATALTALHAGTISLAQAAALVIGMNIGTTVTAGIAAIGAATAAKRVALAHLLFNAVTGIVAFALLPLFVWLLQHIDTDNPTILIAAFHSAFNVLGVLLIVPFTTRFARLVTGIVKERGPRLTRFLDPKAIEQGALATEAVRQTAFEITAAVSASLGVIALGRDLSVQESEDLSATAGALQQTEDFVGRLQFSAPLSSNGHLRHVSTIHALDHLGRLIHLALAHAHDGKMAVPELGELGQRMHTALQSIGEWAENPQRTAPTESIHSLHEVIVESRRALREELLGDTASGRVSPKLAAMQLEKLRWLEEVSYHLWRLTDRLQGERLQDVPEEEEPEDSAGEPASA